MSKKKETIESVRAEVEECVISIGFIAPHCIEPMSAIAAPRDFFDPVVGRIWQMMVDFVTTKADCDAQMFLLEAKKRGYIDELGGVANLVKMINKQPNHAHFEHYAREVAKFAELRRIGDAVHHTINMLDEPTADPEKVLYALQARTEGIGNSKDAGFVLLKNVFGKLVDMAKDTDQEAKRSNEVISTGYVELDNLIGGFEKSKLYLLGGRTGMGKSALAENFALNAAFADKSVWFCSLEMQCEELAQRAFSAAAKFDMAKWRKQISDTDMQHLLLFQQTIENLKLWITDRPAESFHTIRAKSRLRKSLDGGLDVVIIDNLQLVRPFDFRPPKHERLKLLTEAFKQLAKDLNVAVIILGQLNAESEKDSSEPDNTSWAGSKAIVDDADVAMLLHRENRDAKTAKLIISKHRAGPVGAVNLNWAGEYQTFSDAHVDELEGSFN